MSQCRTGRTPWLIYYLNIEARMKFPRAPSRGPQNILHTSHEGFHFEILLHVNLLNKPVNAKTYYVNQVPILHYSNIPYKKNFYICGILKSKLN